MKQVAIVHTTFTECSTRESALYLDGRYVQSGDVVTTAKNIAATFGLTLQSIDLAWPSSEEGWGPITENLKGKGILHGMLQQYALDFTTIDSSGSESPGQSIFMAENVNHAIQQLLEEYSRKKGVEIIALAERHLENPTNKAYYETDPLELRLLPQDEIGLEVKCGNISVELYQTNGGLKVSMYSANDLHGNPIESFHLSYEEASAIPSA